MANNVPYLCGGIFFGLILQARKNRVKARDKQKGGSDGLSDADVMKGLVYVVTGESINASGKTLAKATSQYKSCLISDNTYIPFKDTATIQLFDNDLKNKKTDIISRMSEFTAIFINEKKREWLVKAVLEVLQNDETIPDEYMFEYEEGKVIRKSEVGIVEFVDFPLFLLSILHFILMNRPNNEKGRDTFEQWFYRESAHSEWKFESNVGSSIKQQINFVLSGNTMFILGKPSTGKTKQIEHLSDFYRTAGLIRFGTGNKRDKEIPFAKYLEKAKDFYSKTKTLLYSEKPHSFYDFYVCNTLQAPFNTTYKAGLHVQAAPFVIENIRASQLSFLSNFSIINGTGGIGKTMMLRHLLLSGIEEYSITERLPILVSLKNYSSDCDLKGFIYQTVKAFDNDITREQINGLLENGKCIILLDGLDEIISSLRDRFEYELENMTIQYPDNYFVISSRPTTRFLSYRRFSVYKINEFTKKQAIEMIEKLDFYDIETKEKFKKDLEARLYYSHMQFASNPLLLTIMLMTYSSIGDIPRKMHIFYSKAFETMSRLHDATKGAYVRPLHTGLEPEEFAKYFAEFCARTYRDEVLEFTSVTFVEYMKKVLKNKDKNLSCTAWDFLLDLKDNLCIMYEEGEKYYFIHRSFQEYFTAVFFSSQMDDKLPLIAEQFKEMRQKNYQDKTFGMLYDMIPQRIERYVFAPYLKLTWEMCDAKEGYLTFLRYMYRNIYSYVGQVGDYYEVWPADYFYDFIVNENKLRRNWQLDDFDWQQEADHFKKDYARIRVKETTASGASEVVKVVSIESSEFECYMATKENGYEPDYSGSMWEINVDEILDNRSNYQRLIEILEDDEFPLKKEYDLVRQYSERLFARLEKPKSSDDWFDNFGG